MTGEGHRIGIVDRLILTVPTVHHQCHITHDAVGVQGHEIGEELFVGRWGGCRVNNSRHSLYYSIDYLIVNRSEQSDCCYCFVGLLRVCLLFDCSIVVLVLFSGSF